PLGTNEHCRQNIDETATCEDYCFREKENRIIEFRCTSENKMSFSDVKCLPGDICENGECHSTGIYCKQDSENDPSKANYVNLYDNGVKKEGPFTDRCTSSFEVDEVYCDSKSPQLYSYKPMPCPGGELCNYDTGRCEKSSKTYCRPGSGTGQDAFVEIYRSGERIEVVQSECAIDDLHVGIPVCDENDPKLYRMDGQKCPTDQFCNKDSGKCEPLCDITRPNNYISQSTTVLGFNFGNYLEPVSDKCNPNNLNIVDEVICQNGNAEYIHSSCGEDELCNNGYCAVVDNDGDGIPDANELNCINSLFLDPVDVLENSPTFGCSCSQGAKTVRVGAADQDCSELMKQNPCTNGIHDEGIDQMVDCGLYCPDDCGGECVRITPETGSNINILFVPIGFMDPKAGGGIPHLIWVAEASTEALKLATTPPFCKSPGLDESFEAECDGKRSVGFRDSYYGDIIPGEGPFTPNVNIWRLDGYYLGGEKETCILKSTDFKAMEKCFARANLKQMGYYGLCDQPINEVVMILAKEKEGNVAGYTWRDPSQTTLVSIEKTSTDWNIITHEMGHSVCRLEDEYIGSNLNSEAYAEQVNCDDKPAQCEDPEDKSTCKTLLLESEIIECLDDEDCSKNIICKWNPNHPDHEKYKSIWSTAGLTIPAEEHLKEAGCVPGCLGNEYSFRPANPDDNSMMEGDYAVGPTSTQRGSWNTISYAWCKALVDKEISG
ncbi:MAG: hypothetical protein NDI94_02405, partial [Candidatus Woesearchaeota archaeon]|nr:hypothetical protein [Candidatus Woesearchaeota archaeon]